MATLALDCSTKLASVAILQNEKCFSRTSNNPKSHSEFLNTAIAECLVEAELPIKSIKKIAVTRGPGSFTGIRVAISIAKTFSFSLNCPIYAYDTLSLLDLNNNLKQEPMTFVMTNAHKNMVFFAAYRNHKNIIKAQALTMDDLHALNWRDFGQGICIGDGYNAYASRFKTELIKYLIREVSISDYPNTQLLAESVNNSAKSIQPIDWKTLQPLYLRASEAEENLRLTSKS